MTKTIIGVVCIAILCFANNTSATTFNSPLHFQWYNFDDIRTKSIAEQDVVTNDAYILFYQRQSSLFNSSQSSSSDSSNAEHWVFR